MERYRIELRKNLRTSNVVGILLTALGHIAALVYLSVSGLTYLIPPPPEQSLLIDFEQPDEEVKVEQVYDGSRPQSEQPDKTRPLNIVQRSEAQNKGTKTNKAPEAKVDDFGDVEKYEPVREKEIDRRALFSAADNPADKDTLAAQTASKVSDALKAGHAQGNTVTGKTAGEPNADLKGRTVLGSLPKPSYSVQKAGTVVVSIWVDQYGVVQKAVPGAVGTTVTDSQLWAAARAAAMKASFNQKADAPAMQEGKITYIFKLR